MPYTKDSRCGPGWFEVNLSHFYDYLDDRSEELIVRGDFSADRKTYDAQLKFYDDVLNEEIEERANEYISWKIFNETRKPLDEGDLLPDAFCDVWAYVYHHVCRLVARKPIWYLLRNIHSKGEAWSGSKEFDDLMDNTDPMIIKKAFDITETSESLTVRNLKLKALHQEVFG